MSRGVPDPKQYDAWASEYEAHAEVAPYNALYDRPATLDLLGEVSGRRVLDAGCGPGIYLEELLKRGADLTGCDASPQMIDLAKSRIRNPEVDLRVQSLDEPFDWVADGSVDLALAALVYHYINDRVAFLAEMHRVLKPDGALVISTHHATEDWLRLGGSYFEVVAVTERWSRGWEVTAWKTPLSHLTEEFADAGFLIERLIEPQPQTQMRDLHPEAYEKLSTRPAFIIFRLVKQT